MIPLHVAARCLSLILEQSAHRLLRGNASLIKKRQAAVLRVDAEEIDKFSRTSRAKAGTLPADLFGYLTAFCYGHRAHSDIILWLSRPERTGLGLVPGLKEIPDPFQARAQYVLSIFSAF